MSQPGRRGSSKSDDAARSANKHHRRSPSPRPPNAYHHDGQQTEQQQSESESEAPLTFASPSCHHRHGRGHGSIESGYVASVGSAEADHSAVHDRRTRRPSLASVRDTSSSSTSRARSSTDTDSAVPHQATQQTSNAYYDSSNLSSFPGMSGIQSGNVQGSTYGSSLGQSVRDSHHTGPTSTFSNSFSSRYHHPTHHHHQPGSGSASGGSGSGETGVPSGSSTSTSRRPRESSIIPPPSIMMPSVSEDSDVAFHHIPTTSTAQGVPVIGTATSSVGGQSSGTSNSNSSSWSFFRSSSGNRNNASNPTIDTGAGHNPSTRQYHSESFSSIRDRFISEPVLSPVTAASGSTSGAHTPSMQQHGTGGTMTPLGGGGAASAMSGLMMLNKSQDQYLRARMHGLAGGYAEGKKRSNMNASYTFYDSRFSGSNSNASGISGSPSGIQSSSKRNKSRTYSSSSDIGAGMGGRRKADGLVAMAARKDNTLEDSRVVVAGRSLLKILSITPNSDYDPLYRPHSDEERSDSDEDEPSEPYFRFSRHSRRKKGSRPSSRSTSRAPSTDRRRDTPVNVVELLDLLPGQQSSGSSFSGGKGVNKSALINDVSWGYGVTANKIMTGNSNGTVALYDIEKTGNKLERIKTHHSSGRAINVVSFAGQAGQGILLASGCQDGDIKISDYRHNSQITMSSPLDPVRSICFPPQENCTADPFHLISAAESGNIFRWDLRQPKNPLDRIMAHQGGVLSLDWKGSCFKSGLKSSSEGQTGGTDKIDTEGVSSTEGGAGKTTAERLADQADAWGWLASAGMDGTVKIWDMSAQNHTPRLVTTLYANRPIGYIRWHTSSSRPFDLVVVPQSTSGSSASIGSSTDGHWLPDIEIWDVRRTFLPKETIWSGSSVIACTSPLSNPDVLWSLDKSSSSFQQIDVERESVRPLDYVPKVTAAWSAEGSLAFAVKTQAGDDSIGSVEPSLTVLNTTGGEARPVTQSAGIVDGIDPTFDLPAFTYLADEYRIKHEPTFTLSELCEANAEVALNVGRQDAAKVWKLAGQWLQSTEPDPTQEPDVQITPALTGRSKNSAIPPSPKIVKSTSPSAPQLRRTRSNTLPAAPLHPFHKDFALQMNHQAKHRSPLVTSHVPSDDEISPEELPAPVPKTDGSAKKENKPTRPPHVHRSTNNSDLVGSDTSVVSSVSEDQATDDAAPLLHESPSSSGGVEDTSDKEDAATVASEGEDEQSVTTNPAMSLSVASLLTKKRAAVPTISRQASIDPQGGLPTVRSTRHRHASSTSQSSSSTLATPRAGIPMAASASHQRLAPLLSLSDISALADERRANSLGTILPTLSTSRQSSSHTVKESSESSASEEEEDRTGSDDEHEGTAEGFRARAKRRHQTLQRNKSRRSRSSNKRRIPSRDDVARKNDSKDRSISADSRRRNPSKVKALALRHKLETQKLEAKEVLDQKMKEHFVKAIQELADEGDIQTSATLAFVMRERLDLPSSTMARLTSAYINLLRTLDCHLPSADLTKNTSVESIRGNSQENTTLHTACGKCEKALHNPPFGKCKKCSAAAALCCICHEVEGHSLVFCATCGHGVHEECLYRYANEQSTSPFVYNPFDEGYATVTGRRASHGRGAPMTPSTAPSSPMVMSSASSAQWLLPSEQALFTTSYFPSRVQSRVTSPSTEYEMMDSSASRSVLLMQCPSGCGHSCLLSLPLAELPVPPEPMTAFEVSRRGDELGYDEDVVVE